MTRQHYRSALAEFHDAFEVEPFGRLTHPERLALVALRSTLIAEETAELFEAVSDYHAMPTAENKEHLAKETADLLYVTVGTAHLLGLPLSDPQPDVLASSFFAAFDLNRASKDAQQDLDDIFRFLDSGEPDETISMAQDDLAPTLQSLTDEVAELAVAYTIPLQAVFDAVHASNMSKVDPELGKPFRREDGKILKGPWYRAPDIGAVLKSAA